MKDMNIIFITLCKKCMPPLSSEKEYMQVFSSLHLLLHLCSHTKNTFLIMFLINTVGSIYRIKLNIFFKAKVQCFKFQSFIFLCK